jgi:hypothetical protein
LSSYANLPYKYLFERVYWSGGKILRQPTIVMVIIQLYLTFEVAKFRQPDPYGKTNTFYLSEIWDDPNTWAGGIVPPAEAIVVIKNNITINVDIACYSLKVEPPTGSITVNPGINVTIIN